MTKKISDEVELNVTIDADFEGAPTEKITEFQTSKLNALISQYKTKKNWEAIPYLVRIITSFLFAIFFFIKVL
ncbi:MAG: hypothetical protein SGJ04_10555 [Bacteroidota bacterium]|nr:hypothetical protein [Bacteroidota bacterium]